MNKQTIKYGEVLQINTAGDMAASTRLKAGQVIALRKASDRTLVCTSGRLWVTRENDHEDYVLAENQSLPIGTKGKVVVAALGQGSFRLG